MVSIGFDSYQDQGPGIFLYRLEQELIRRGQFSHEDPDVWVQLSFKALPPAIAERQRQGRTRVLVRMNGCHCVRAHVLKGKDIPMLDEMLSKKVNDKKNRPIVENLKHADGIVFQSQFSKKLTHKFVTKTRPGAVIYNGVPVNQFSPEGTREYEMAGRFNMLAAHSFRPYHRLHDQMKILAAMKLIFQKAGFDRDAHLNILGGDDGISFAYARKMANTLGLQEGRDFTFWGKVPFDSLGRIYRTCDLMLNLSYWDACPNVVIEAMAAGLPVVGVNHAGVGELVGNGGKLVDEKIPFTYLDHMDFDKMPQAPVEAYVEAVLEMANEQQRMQYAQQALARAKEHFDISRICDQYIAAAELAMKNKPVKVTSKKELAKNKK